MHTSKATLIEWTVRNNPEENGSDARTIDALFAVSPGSVLALAVAALSGTPVRMILDLGDDGDGSEGIEVFCEINPPWGAKKNGGFQFRAGFEYSGSLVRQLAVVTQGVSLVIGLDQVQEELELSEERALTMGLFNGLAGAGHDKE